MKRKLIFVILVAMVLAPVSAFAAPVVNDLEFDKTIGTVTVSGSGFAANEFLSVLSAFAADPDIPGFLTADYADQVVTDADGNFSFTFPSSKALRVDDDYAVQVSAATGGPLVKYLNVQGSTALLNAPLLFSGKITKEFDIAATYPGTGWEISSSNPAIVQVLPYDNEQFLDGFKIKCLKTGQALIYVKAGGQVAGISVLVTS